MIMKPFNDSKIANAKTDKERNGYLNEKQTAYLIDFEFKDHEKAVVLHDVKFEYNGRVAQIDHLIVDHSYISVIESKLFNGVLEIGENSWVVDYGKSRFSIPSPVLQNKRHISVLKEIIENEKIFPSFRTAPEFINAVVVSNKTIIRGERPDELVYADSFAEWEKKARWKHLLRNPMRIFKAAVKFQDTMSPDEVIASAQRLLRFCSNCRATPDRTTVVKTEETIPTPMLLATNSLIDEMKRLRSRLAAENNVAMIHHVFSDDTLAEFDAVRPSSKEAMLQIAGVGEIKFERYGKQFMALWSTAVHDKEVPVCKRCGSPMVFRKGRDRRGDFYGCSTYPRCRYIVPCAFG